MQSAVLDKQQQQLNDNSKLGRYRKYWESPKLPPNRRLIYTALHQAVLDSRVEQVRILTNCGSDVNCRDLFGRTPLMLCCLLDNEIVGTKLAFMFINAGAELGYRDNLGRSALAYACLCGRQAILRVLLQADCVDFCEPDNDGNTPLHHASIRGDAIVLRLLLTALKKYSGDVDQRNRLGYSSLLLACRHSNYLAAALLLQQANASPELCDNEYFLNAMQWLDRDGKAEQGRQTVPSPRSPRTAPRRIMRPTIFSEKLSAKFSGFYKQLTCPDLRCTCIAPEFQQSKSFPKIPRSAYTLIREGPPEVVSLSASSNEMSRSSIPSEADTKTDLLSLSDQQLKKWIRDHIEVKLRRHIQYLGIQPTPPKFSISRPTTRELAPFRIISKQSSCETINQLLQLYLPEPEAIKSFCESEEKSDTEIDCSFSETCESPRRWIKRVSIVLPPGDVMNS